MSTTVQTSFHAQPSAAEALLREGRPDEALQALTAQVRAAPADAAARVFLFQLLAVCGQWARARTQLEAAVRLDAANAMPGAAWAALLDAEAVRLAVFAGERLPVVI